ncbi:MAG: sensor histidine kinase [Acidimicrobiia bacterium]|nr:sensor histidine kinase [Acidimicrobiia bacterium]
MSLETAAPARRSRLMLSGRLAAAGTILASICLAMLTLTRVLVGWPDHLWVAFVIAGAVAVSGVLAGLHPTVARQSDQILVQSSAVGGAFAAVLVLFLVTVVGLGRVPQDDERSLVILAMAGAGVGALVFAPVRDVLARRVREMVASSEGELDDVLTVFSRRIARDVPLEEALLQSAETLRRSMALSTVEIWVGTGGRLTCATSVPERDSTALLVEDSAAAAAVRAGVAGPAWLRVWLPDLLDGRAAQIRVAPLGFAGDLLGLIVVERGAVQDFDAAEDEVLAELARRMSLTLHNTQLDHALQDTLEEVLRQARELEASRRRLVSASDEERRRIERDLHDGAQQHLVALSVGLNLTAGMLDDDPGAAAEMLAALQSSVRDTIEELRSLAHGIYPPLLRDGGLEPALRAAAGRCPLDVVVEAATGRQSAEIEAAIYFCCLEALQNAAKHAPGSSVAIRAWTEEGGLLFEVADDGPGFDPASVTHNAGYTNMADRLGAIGGRVEWRSVPGGGTTVAGTVPLSPPTSA